jgi:transcriptional regulator with XRE-family HTH domain
MATALAQPVSQAAPAFGRLLKHWRSARRMSQLTLATEAGISTRHLSFLETGRAHPSREMVDLLAAMLDVPFTDRNELLLGAGFAPAYGQRPLEAPELESLNAALHFILRQQEPYPALVLDGEWNILRQNEASRRIFRLFRQPGVVRDNRPPNAIRSLFDPSALRPFVVNWEELASDLMTKVNRQAALDPDGGIARLREELLKFPDVPARWSVPQSPELPRPPMMTLRLRRDDLSLAFFSMISTLGTPCDITLQQLKIECFFPADAVTEQTARRLATDLAA